MVSERLRDRQAARQRQIRQRLFGAREEIEIRRCAQSHFQASSSKGRLRASAQARNRDSVASATSEHSTSVRLFL